MNSFELDVSMVQYESYLIEREMCSYDLQLSILESGDLSTENYMIIKESVMGKLKEWFDKLIALWHDFKDKIKAKFDSIALTNDAILKKYKDLITTKPFKGTVTIYNYNTKLFNDNNVPQFNYESFKDVDNLAEDLKSKHFNIYNRANGDTFKDKITNAIHSFSEMKTYKDTQVDLKNMYTACLSIKTWVDTINKNIDTVESACNSAKNKLTNDPTAKPDMQQTPNKEEPKTESTLLEADDNKTKFSVNTSSTNNKDSDTNNSKPNNSNINNSKPNNDKPNKVDTIINNAVNNKDTSTSENDNIYKCIAAYHKVCSDYLTTKSTILYQMQSEYMAVIREHIKLYNGNVANNVNDKPDKANTDNLAKNIKKDVERYNNTDNSNEKATIRSSIFSKFKKIFGDKADDMTNKVLGDK